MTTKLGFKHTPTGSLLVVEIVGNRIISFATLHQGLTMYSTIDGLKFSKVGMLKSFPDLKDLDFAEMKKEAMKRFKQKIKEMKTEQELHAYIVDDLKNHGYVLYKTEKKGFRTNKV